MPLRCANTYYNFVVKITHLTSLSIISSNFVVRKYNFVKFELRWLNDNCTSLSILNFVVKCMSFTTSLYFRKKNVNFVVCETYDFNFVVKYHSNLQLRCNNAKNVQLCRKNAKLDFLLPNFVVKLENFTFC